MYMLFSDNMKSKKHFLFMKYVISNNYLTSNILVHDGSHELVVFVSEERS